jgi:hypothetical protein
MAQSFKDGGTDVEIYAWSRVVALSSGGKQRGTHCSWMVSPADVVGRRRCDIQEQRTCGYGATPLGAGGRIKKNKRE